jgi:hypothetical protein
MSSEPILLTSVPGKTENDRLALFLHAASPAGHLSLCQQSWAEGIGWFTQSKVEFDASQVGSLRQALGQGGGDLRSTFLPPKPSSHQPTLRVVG